MLGQPRPAALRAPGVGALLPPVTPAPGLLHGLLSPTAPPGLARSQTQDTQQLLCRSFCPSRVQARLTGRSENRAGDAGGGLARGERAVNVAAVAPTPRVTVRPLPWQKTTGCCSWRPRPWTPPTWSWPSRLSSKVRAPLRPAPGPSPRLPEASVGGGRDADTQPPLPSGSSALLGAPASPSGLPAAWSLGVRRPRLGGHSSQ